MNARRARRLLWMPLLRSSALGATMLSAVLAVSVLPSQASAALEGGALAGGDPLPDAAPQIHCEPGFRLPAGELLIPLTALAVDGRPIKPQLASLVCLIDDQPAEIVALDASVPAVILVISDQFLAPEVWTETAVHEPDSPHWLGIWDASAEPQRHQPPQPAASGPLPLALPETHAPRLWDAVLMGIRELALLPDAPVRRVILVVGDLRAEDASLHPMAACLEAARDLAIPIHGAALDKADPLAVSRLQRLAEASGGSFSSAGSTHDALAAGLTRIGAARALILTDPGRALPLAVTVNAGGGKPDGHARIVQRPHGRYAPGAGLVAAGMILLGAAAGLLAWLLWRRRPIGYLVSVDVPDFRLRAIPAAGLTIGRTKENDLTLAENRISKHHALVRWRRGQVQLIDLRSTNGTQVGGRHVRTAALNDGDTIVFADAVTVQFRRRAPRSQDRT